MENNEKTAYLLYHVEYLIIDYIWKVIEDSEEDPEFSAVTASNLIKCFISTMELSGKKLPYNDVETFFKYHFSCDDGDNGEYDKFINRYDKEKVYYHGTIY